jgi:hypothetical protein
MTTNERVGSDDAGRTTLRRHARDGARRPGLGSPSSMHVLAIAVFVLAAIGLSCAASDSGGMSGTGISQGSISSFGSIFVNGVEWDLDGATIEIDGTTATDAALRVGMVVRVEGDRSGDGLSGDARRVVFDDSIEGPIEATPVETIPGVEKTFGVLGTTIVMRVGRTSFDDGASFAGLAADDVVEVSGFVDAAGAVQATRIERKGVFPTLDEIELRGQVANLVKNPDNTGLFDLGPITIRYTAATPFEDVTRTTLANGNLVEVKGDLRVTGDEVDATRIELESSGLGSDDSDDVKLEGIVADCAESPDYCVNGIPVDDSGATFDPPGFAPMPGDLVECEGRLEDGVLIAEEVESEDDDESRRDVRIDAAISSIDPVARTLVVLGVTIVADGDTRLEDDSDLDDDTLTFAELAVGQFVEIEAISTGTSTARALSIDREDAEVGDDDVRLEGPVTALDPIAPSLSILGQAIPLDAGTVYRDDLDQTRTEEEFFRTPGDVALGDIVRAKDESAANLSVLSESDEVEIQGEGEIGDDGDDDDDDDDDDG